LYTKLYARRRRQFIGAPPALQAITKSAMKQSKLANADRVLATDASGPDNGRRCTTPMPPWNPTALPQGHVRDYDLVDVRRRGRRRHHEDPEAEPALEGVDELLPAHRTAGESRGATVDDVGLEAEDLGDVVLHQLHDGPALRGVAAKYLDRYLAWMRMEEWLKDAAMPAHSIVSGLGRQRMNACAIRARRPRQRSRHSCAGCPAKSALRYPPHGRSNLSFALTSSAHCGVTDANFEALRERQSRHRTWSARATPVTLPLDAVTDTSKG